MWSRPPTRFVSQREVEENDARYRRSNPGGDDLITKIIFAVILLAIAGWITIAWINRAHTATKAPSNVVQPR